MLCIHRDTTGDEIDWSRLALDWHSTLHFVDCDVENIITLKSTTPAKFGLTIESTGGPMCMTVAGKDFYAGLSVEALGCDTDAANPQNNDWLILKS